MRYRVAGLPTVVRAERAKRTTNWSLGTHLRSPRTTEAPFVRYKVSERKNGRVSDPVGLAVRNLKAAHCVYAE
jgi:hypothetical protein